MDLSILKGRKVLVTGDTGFKGSWICQWLADAGAQVSGLALPPAGERPLFTELKLENRISHIDCDIRDLDAVQAALNRHQPELVLHMAAQAIVRTGYEEPKRTFDTNVGGTVNVLEAIRHTPSVRACVVVTSDKCYDNVEWVFGYRENDHLGGYEPYGASKAAAEMAFSAYAHSYFAKTPDRGIVSARAGNVIGGGDWAEARIVPDCIRALAAGRPVVLRSPHSTRPWQHVLEPLSGYLTLACRLLADPKAINGSWNFGPESSSICTVEELTRQALAIWGSGELVINADPNAPKEARLLHLSTDKAQLDLAWRPRWNTQRAIAETVGWYKEVLGGQSALEVTRRQIAAYMESGR